MILLAVVTSIANAWVWLITSALPLGLRDRQRAERAAHIRDQIAHSASICQTPLRTASEIAWALVVGMPADVTFALTRSLRIMKSDPNKEMDPNWKLLIAPIWAAVVISVVVVMIHGPEHVRQSSHLVAVRWVRAVGGIVLFVSAASALVRQGLSKTRNGNIVFPAIASSVLIGAYLVRLGLSPR